MSDPAREESYSAEQDEMLEAQGALEEELAAARAENAKLKEMGEDEEDTLNAVVVETVRLQVEAKGYAFEKE